MLWTHASSNSIDDGFQRYPVGSPKEIYHPEKQPHGLRHAPRVQRGPQHKHRVVRSERQGTRVQQRQAEVWKYAIGLSTESVAKSPAGMGSEKNHGGTTTARDCEQLR